ncbi:MAG TPA: DUF2474 domain-containing protein [Steroidobacteraceae bacterium]|nr:DUF2474 domain-containing protein [Steroidobacteraceae bacterium]
MGRGCAGTADPRVHGLVVLGVQGQGRTRGLSLTRNSPEDAPLARRLGWMALIWATSIAALGVVSLLIRWWLR